VTNNSRARVAGHKNRGYSYSEEPGNKQGRRFTLTDSKRDKRQCHEHDKPLGQKSHGFSVNLEVESSESIVNLFAHSNRRSPQPLERTNLTIEWPSLKKQQINGMPQRNPPHNDESLGVELGQPRCAEVECSESAAERQARCQKEESKNQFCESSFLETFFVGAEEADPLVGVAVEGCSHLGVGEG
jgi:hypothetical protein